jgi:hypothetical protein
MVTPVLSKVPWALSLAVGEPMLRKIGRLFVIKTRFEAFLIIYALALGATARGAEYLHTFPGLGGKLLFLATTGAVFLAGAKILDCLRLEKEVAELRAQLGKQPD